jgi:hypothetical protein
MVGSVLSFVREFNCGRPCVCVRVYICVGTGKYLYECFDAGIYGVFPLVFVRCLKNAWRNFTDDRCIFTEFSCKLAPSSTMAQCTPNIVDRPVYGSVRVLRQ